MMKSSIALAALLVGISQAQAATVTVGAYDVDSNLGATALSNFSGSFLPATTNSGGYPTFTSPASPLYADLIGRLYNGGGTQDRLTFNPNKTAFSGANPNASLQATFGGAIFNNDGNDIYIFESGDAETGSNGTQSELVAASLDGSAGSWITAALLGFLPQNQLGGTGTTFGLYVYAIDLANLGVAVGSSVTSLFFGNTCGVVCNGGGNNPDVEWIGGAAGTAVAAVPVPAGVSLLAGGLGVLGFMGWRRKRNAAAA